MRRHLHALVNGVHTKPRTLPHWREAEDVLREIPIMRCIRVAGHNAADRDDLLDAGQGWRGLEDLPQCAREDPPDLGVWRRGGERSGLL